MSNIYNDPQYPYYVSDPRATRLEHGVAYCYLCSEQWALWIVYAQCLCADCARAEYDRRAAARAAAAPARPVQSLAPDMIESWAARRARENDECSGL